MASLSSSTLTNTIIKSFRNISVILIAYFSLIASGSFYGLYQTMIGEIRFQSDPLPFLFFLIIGLLFVIPSIKFFFNFNLLFPLIRKKPEKLIKNFHFFERRHLRYLLPTMKVVQCINQSFIWGSIGLT